MILIIIIIIIFEIGVFHLERTNQRGWLMKELRFAKQCK